MYARSPTSRPHAADRGGARALALRRRAVQVLAALLLLLAYGVAAFDFGFETRPAPTGKGLEIVAVVPATPAAGAGLQVGDVILKAQGQAVRSAEQFAREVRNVPAGGTLTLQISRQGWEREMKIAAPANRPLYGFTLKAAPGGRGVEIAAVVAGGAASRAGLQASDRVVRAEGGAVTTAAALETLLQEAAARGKPVALTIERGGWAKEVTLVSEGAAEVASGRAPATGSQPASGAPGSLSGALAEAETDYRAGNWRAAEEAYRRLLASAPDDARVWGRLCHVAVMQQRYAEAIDACQRAAALDPREAATCQNLGFTYAATGRPAEAIPWFQKAIDLAPDVAASYAGMGAAQFALRNYAKAEEFYALSLARDPRDQRAWQALADAAGEQGKSAVAIDAYRKAIDIGPPGVALYRGLGWQLAREGRNREAEAALLEGNRQNPRDVDVLMALGVVEQRLGKMSEARQAWERAADIDPSGPNGALARQNLASITQPAPAAVPSPPSAAGSQPPSGAALATPSAAAQQPLAGAAPPGAYAPPAWGAGPGTAMPPPQARSAGALPPPRLAPPAAETGRLKATVAIGDFQIKAATASQYVGDGLREMLLTALHGNGNFIVVERMDIRGLAAEQALSRSSVARPGAAIAEGQMEIADIMVYGAVTEFESEARGGGLTLGMPNVPLTVGAQGKSAHMAVDVRVVDVASGRVLATQRIVGEARSVGLSLGADISTRGVTMPATLSAYANTPMEQAIRDCIEKATAYVVANTPPQYFRHS